LFKKVLNGLFVTVILNPMKINSRVLAQMVLVLGLLFCSLIFTSTWRANTRSQQTISVIGSAKQDIISDIGVLRGAITVTEGSLQSAYDKIRNQTPVVLAYLHSKGVAKNQLELMPITNFPTYEYTQQGYQTGKISSYTVSQRFQVRLADVNKTKLISLEISDLIHQGVNLQMDMPEYYYSKLSDVKVKIQAEAAQDAQMRAHRMAESTSCELGPMRSAKMGVLQITPKNSNVVSDYGINDVSSIEKEITAVVHASFEID
jgi:hypothetical protein